MTARTYTVVGVALLGLTAVSYGVSYLPLGVFGLPVGLGIATVKVLLVALFFMHLVHAEPAERFAALVMVVMVAVLIGLAAADVLTRQPAVDPDIERAAEVIGD